jgi:UDP-4-amino-4,6-dideoxy-N-acetyl-beta-L-altrosamine transaminase
VIPYSRQIISEDDVSAVVDVLRSDLLTQGPVVSKFESAVATYCGATHGIATVNATAALHTAMMLLDVGHNDSVWAPAISFVATANCARYCGATVEFVDVDVSTGLICVDDLERRLFDAKRLNALPKVLIVVHIAGQSANMKQISELCQEYDIKVVEDAAHAFSGEYRDGRIGCCEFSDIAVFSFHPVKPFTTGEGGMLMTNDSDMASRARKLIEHGIERNTSNHMTPTDSFWYYEQHELGYNYRLSDIHSALGLSQLKRVDHFLRERESLADYYITQLCDQSLYSLRRDPECRPSWHLFVVQCTSHVKRNALMNYLRQEGYGTNLHYLPIPFQPYYKRLGARPNDFPNACRYAEISVSLPLFPGLKRRDIDKIISLCQRAIIM